MTRSKLHYVAVISMLFIQSAAYSSKVSSELTQQLNDLLFSRCKKYGYNFIDDGAV